jgi:hypothetical protein
VLCESPTKRAAALAEMAFVISNIASVSPYAAGTFREAQGDLAVALSILKARAGQEGHDFGQKSDFYFLSGFRTIRA